ncbi:DUF86 domain-containing protein [Schaalia turicensis]|uniref:HepT-like ribonuclease domain-containing protein n=1 Tax=Schaalia turicensis TaxID=131111 RepID=UPI0036CCD5F8
MAPPTDPRIVAEALNELTDTVTYIISHGEDTFLARSAESELLYLASCQVVIRLHAMIEDLPKEMTISWSDLPLAAVRGMRNRLAHGYLDIERTLLWETMSAYALPLINAILARIE